MPRRNDNRVSAPRMPRISDYMLRMLALHFQRHIGALCTQGLAMLAQGKRASHEPELHASIAPVLHLFGRRPDLVDLFEPFATQRAIHGPAIIRIDETEVP